MNAKTLGVFGAYGRPLGGPGAASAFKKKFRWTFEAKSKDGTVTFPQSFVKVSARPDFPYSVVADEHGGHKEYKEYKEYVPGAITITQFFTFYDSHLEFSKALFDFFSKANIQETNSGLLNLYDGCGKLLEQWEFEDVTIKIIEDDSNIENEEAILNWSVSYQKCEWINVNKNQC